MITLFINKFYSLLKNYIPHKETTKAVQNNSFPVKICGVQQGLSSFVIDSIYKNTGGSSLIVLPAESEAENLYQDLKLFSENTVFLFPHWNTIPYSNVSPLSSVFSKRAEVLINLLLNKHSIIICSIKAFLCPVPDPDYLFSKILKLKKNSELDIMELIKTLVDFGYIRVPRVTVKGEFAVRGDVIDIFTPGINTEDTDDNAVRIVTSFDEIEEIRIFNSTTQSSVKNCDEITLFPLKEVTSNSDFFNSIKKALLNYNCSEDDIKKKIENLQTYPDKNGIEQYFPLCFNSKYSLLSYLNDKSNLILIDDKRLTKYSEILRKEYLDLYRKVLNENSTIPRPKDILIEYQSLIDSFEKQIIFSGIKSKDQIDFKSTPPRSFFGNIKYFVEESKNLLKLDYNIFICAVYPHQEQRIKNILNEKDIIVLPISISQGFIIPELKIIVIQENEIFGRKKRIPRSIATAKTEEIESFIDLNPGDYIVHINYGIGLFVGIKRILAAGNERDYVQLEYAEKETLFIPIEQVNLIQKYIAQDNRRVKLDRMGGKSWENRKQKVKQSVEKLAGLLVKIYSERIKISGYAFSKDTDWQTEFEAGFPYQETEDQLRCISEVKLDMEKPYPMDRLVCGDVGYGKTEIALRASFKAVMGGKQIALLAPTTILVEQHFENYLERFKNFPVKVEMLSRFRTKKEQKEVIEKLALNEVDIVIGTHRLIQKDVLFKNLGLMIVDEEQRFGVKDKERLKQMKISVDCLTLTATPIPRTLHMSLMKIRDMSLLNTPPHNRQPIETIINEFDPELISKAIRAEINRNGQVYYLHNRVQTIPEVKSFLQELLPEVSIHYAHGQMNNDELEDIMHSFIKNEFQVLLSTTIIENGLDIPNVNTIIIDGADMFGISQLYQLKGRVGRSEVLAYAYLLYPESRALSELAMKRLRIISDFTELGSGFKIALKDLEIRGAGNMLGREQTGDILAVGYDMYIRLLDVAVKELRDEKEDIAPDVYLELVYTGYIPDSYIKDPMTKMEVYKQIASITTDEDHDKIYFKLKDQFGHVPDEVMSIISISEIRIICKKLFINSLKERDGIVTVEFAKVSKISTDNIMRLLTESGGRVYLNSKQPNCLFLKTGKIELKEKSEYIKEQLSRLI